MFKFFVIFWKPWLIFFFLKKKKESKILYALIKNTLSDNIRSITLTELKERIDFSRWIVEAGNNFCLSVIYKIRIIQWGGFFPNEREIYGDISFAFDWWIAIDARDYNVFFFFFPHFHFFFSCSLKKKLISNIIEMYIEIFDAH